MEGLQSALTCIGFIAFFLIIFGTIALTRWFKHREVMAMVERGVLPEQYVQYASEPRRQESRGLFIWGVALAMLGLALIIGLWPLGNVWSGTEIQYPLNFGPWMLIGLVPLFIGLALLIIYFLVRKEEAPRMNKTSKDEISPPGD
jgi:hypothetical protein